MLAISHFNIAGMHQTRQPADRTEVLAREGGIYIK